MLKKIIGLRLELPQERLGLFMHNGVVRFHCIVVQVLVESTAVLPPPDAIGHHTEGPGKVHSD
jgi:hypothetical protein